MNINLKNLSQWLKANKLSFHVKKTDDYFRLKFQKDWSQNQI